MGYLTDNTSIGPYGRYADCPDLYPYELVVVWQLNDKFTYPNGADTMGLAVKEVVPDVEDWQYSVVRGYENRVKFRFKDEATRTLAKTKLTNYDIGAIVVIKLVELNPPDRVRRGIP